LSVGTLGDPGGSRAVGTARDIYQFVDADGVFAGVSLNGTVVGARERLNRMYYGSDASTEGIVLDRRFDRPETITLKQALGRVS
jgi:lipid-binding SYLF domain-containing protein